MIQNGDSDVNRLVKGTFYSYGSLVMIKLIMAFNSIIVARLLEPESLGVLTILDQIGKVIIVFAYLGIPLALVKYISESRIDDSNKLGNYLGTAFITTAFFTVFFCSMYAIFRNQVAYFYKNNEISNLVIYSAVTVCMYSFWEVGSSILRGLHKIKLLSIANTCRWAITIPVNIVMILKFGLLGAVLGLMISAVLGLAIMIYIVNSQLAKSKLTLRTISFDKKALRKLLNYGLPALLSDMLVAVPMWFAVSYLSSHADFASIGYYRVSISLTMILMFIPMALAIPIIPLFSELEKNDFKRLEKFFHTSMRLTALTMMLATSTIAIFSKYIIPIIYGLRYYTAWHILFLLCICFYFYALSNIIGYLIAGTGRMWEGGLLNLAWALVFGFFSVILISRYGLNGFGLAYLFSYIIHTINSFIYLKYRLRISITRIADVILLGLGFYSAAYFLLTTAAFSKPMNLALSCLLWIALLAALFSILTQEDRSMIRTLIATAKAGFEAKLKP